MIYYKVVSILITANFQLLQGLSGVQPFSALQKPALSCGWLYCQPMQCLHGCTSFINGAPCIAANRSACMKHNPFNVIAGLLPIRNLYLFSFMVLSGIGTVFVY